MAAQITYHHTLRLSGFTALMLCFSFAAIAQRSAMNVPVEEKGVLLHNEWSIGGRLNTNGWEIFGERSKIKSIHKTRIIQFGFSEIKHWKERKQQAEYTFLGSNLESPKNFYYAKQNLFYTLRAGYGFRKNIADKAEKNGVRVSLSYLGGITIGLLKPYYLDLAYPVEDNDPNVLTFIIVSQKYSEKNHDKFLDWYSIAGASGFKYGITEIEPVPGVYGKFGLNFDWAGKEEFVKELEAGLILDLYYKRIPIMVSDDNKFYFLSAYISFQFGKRW